MKTSRLITAAFCRPWAAIFPLIAAVLLLCGSRADASLTLSPSTIANDYTGPLDFTITGLDSAGQTVIIEEFLDADGSGTITASDVLLGKFSVTDGQVASIGGQRNLNVPGDEDGTADSQIHTRLLYGTNGGLGLIDGLHMFRVSPSGSGFASFTTTFLVTQKDYFGSGISGTVVGGSPQTVKPGSVVLLQKAGPDGNTVAITFAGIGGNYSIKAPPGDYQIIASKAGFVFDYNAAPILTVTAGSFLTSQTVTLAAGQRTISGQVLNATSLAGVPGQAIFGQSQAGHVSITLTNASGNFVMDATTDPWKFELEGTAVARLGLVGIRPTESSAGSVTGFNVNLPPATALIYGTLKTPANVPVAFADIGGGTDGSPKYKSKAVTDANGNYVLNVVNGTWNYSPFSSSPNPNYVVVEQNVTVSGSDILQNLIVYPVTAHLRGTVKDNNGNPVGNLALYANAQDPANPNGSNLNVTATADANGNFDLGVFGGIGGRAWNIGLQNQDNAPPAYIGSNPTYAVQDGVNQTGLVFTVYPITTHIIGSVKDGQNNAIGGVQVFGDATVAGTPYSSFTTTDGSGNYSLPAFAGTWDVGVSNDGLHAQGYLVPGNQTAIVTTAPVTLNFIAPQATATIAGSVKDALGNPIGGVQVFGSATVAGTSYSSSATTDANGNYSMPVIAGTWNVSVSSDDLQAQGYLLPSNQSAVVTTGTVTLDFIAAQATASIHGSVKTPSGTPLAFVQVSAHEFGGLRLQANAQTDAGGNYVLGVTVGSWDVRAENIPGYVTEEKNVIVNTNGSNVLQNLIVHPVTAHLRGQIRDNHGAPVGNLEILATDSNFVNANVGTITDASGNFDLAVYGGEGAGLAKGWQLQLPEGGPSNQKVYVSSFLGFSVYDNTDINGINYLVYIVTAHLRGHVLDETDAPVSNIAIGASNWNIGASSGSDVDANGFFDIPLFGGTWGLGLSLIQGLGLIQQDAVRTVTDGVDQNNIVVRCRHTTAVISGSLKDTHNNPIGGVQVFANASLGGIAYSTSTVTDANGIYSLPVFSETWDVGMSGSDLQALGYQPPANQSAFVNTGTVTLNFIAQDGTVATLAATGVTGTGATLHGTVNPGGLSTTVSFDYGLTSSYGSNVAAVPSPISGNSATAVSAALTGLAPGTYHFRVKAVNSGGTSTGGDLIFTVATAVQSWRQQYFGSPANSGDGADFNDYDKDGILNIVEFAFGLNPKQNSAGQLPQGLKVGTNFVVSFPQPAGVTGITYGAEWNTTLSGAWTPISDSGTLPQHTFSVPIGLNTQIFLHLTVTVP